MNENKPLPTEDNSLPTGVVLFSALSIALLGVVALFMGKMGVPEAFVYMAVSAMAFSAVRNPRATSTLTSVGSTELLADALVPLVWSFVDFASDVAANAGTTALSARACQLGLAAVFFGSALAFWLITHRKARHDDPR